MDTNISKGDRGFSEKIAAGQSSSKEGGEGVRPEPEESLVEKEGVVEEGVKKEGVVEEEPGEGLEEEPKEIGLRPELKKEAGQEVGGIKEFDEGEINGLLGIAEKRGLPSAINAANRSGYHRLDAFHDFLARDERYRKFF